MTETISPQVRLFAIVGIIAATALGAFFLLVARPLASEGSAPTTAPGRTETTPSPRTRARSGTTPVRTSTGYPGKIDRALRRNRVVVVAVYMPGSSVDRVVLAEARAGAARGRATYVPIRATSERVAGQLVSKTGVVQQPAVLVLRPPGVVTATLGVTDRETVAHAVSLARR